VFIVTYGVLIIAFSFAFFMALVVAANVVEQTHDERRERRERNERRGKNGGAPNVY
jgi:hypothetical protein